MSRNAISFPVYVRECGNEVRTFASLEELDALADFIDAEDGEFEAWDAEGRRLQLTVAGMRSDGKLLRITENVVMSTPSGIALVPTGGAAAPEEFARIRSAVLKK